MYPSGLSLESGALLEWGLAAKQLLLIDSPEYRIKLPRYNIGWPKQTVLCGLHSSISVVLYNEQKLSELTLHTWQDGDINARNNFERVAVYLDEIANSFGRRSIEKGGSTPKAEWKLGSTKANMHIFDRLGEVCVLTITGKYNAQTN